jgi:predicted small lipoprotein YifL
MRYLVILVALMAAGCGQKGALFLPEIEPETAPKEGSSEQPEQSADTNP